MLPIETGRNTLLGPYSLSIGQCLATTVPAADEVKIDVTQAVECERKSQKGDKISVHYRGTLANDGIRFDASYDRSTPLSLIVGDGQVFKGWLYIKACGKCFQRGLILWFDDSFQTQVGW
jgi:hypothetical protein